MLCLHKSWQYICRGVIIEKHAFLWRNQLLNHGILISYHNLRTTATRCVGWNCYWLLFWETSTHQSRFVVICPVSQVMPGSLTLYRTHTGTLPRFKSFEVLHSSFGWDDNHDNPASPWIWSPDRIGSHQVFLLRPLTRTRHMANLWKWYSWEGHGRLLRRRKSQECCAPGT